MYSALKSAGLDLWHYECGGYPGWFLAKVLVHWQNEHLIKMHTIDAQNKKTRRKRG